MNSSSRVIIHWVLKPSAIGNAGFNEIFLEPFKYELVSIGDTVSFGSFKATIIPSLTGVEIFKAGSGFFIGELFSVPAFVPEIATIEIKEVTPTGGILSASILNFGYGYNTTFSIDIVAGQKTEVVPNGQLSDSTSGFIEAGYFTALTYCDVSYCDTSYCGDLIESFYEDNSIDSSLNPNIAILNFLVGAVRIYPGFYSDSSGFLSDSYVLQDGFYYQIFSYVLSSIESIASFRDPVKKLIHPAGVKMFANQQFTDTFILDDITVIYPNQFELTPSETLELTDVDTKYVFKGLTDIIDMSYLYYWDTGYADIDWVQIMDSDVCTITLYSATNGVSTTTSTNHLFVIQDTDPLKSIENDVINVVPAPVGTTGSTGSTGSTGPTAHTVNVPLYQYVDSRGNLITVPGYTQTVWY